MKSAKTASIDFLVKRLRILRFEHNPEILSKLEQIGNGTINEFKPWTPLKLATLSYYTQQYLNIIRGLEERKGSVETFYIDIFAGSGLNKVEGMLFAGSPLIAIDCASEAKRHFDYILLNDLEYGRILEKRIKKLPNLDERYSWLDNAEIIVYREDANVALVDFVKEFILKARYKQYLAFIDPFRSEISRNALEELLRIPYGDIFMTFQARSIAREIGGYNTGIKGKKIEDELTKFFGVPSKVWSQLNSEQKVFDYYIDNVIGKYKPFVETVRIRGGKSARGFEYALIFATSKKNPGWVPLIYNMKKIETFDGDVVKTVIDALLGKSITLDNYIQKNDKEEDKDTRTKKEVGLQRWFELT